MAKNKQPKDKEESLMEAVIMVIIAFVVLFALVWVIASNKIAYYSAPGLWYMGYPWSFINADKWNFINEGYMYIRQNPKKIGFAYYMQFANLCLRPLAAMFGLVTTAYIASLFFGKDKGGGGQAGLVSDAGSHGNFPIIPGHHPRFTPWTPAREKQASQLA